LIITTKKSLKNISALFLISGGLILFIKGYFLLKEANQLNYDVEAISLVMASAFVIGLLKNKYLMLKFNIKNIERIENLKNPKIHQFFELKFFLYLVLMIISGALLSTLASGNYNALLIVGGIDLSLSTALLKSSTFFFNTN
jgi:hypothetical protein